MEHKQLLSLVLFLSASALAIWWTIAAIQMPHQTRQLVEVKDEIFGTTTTVWKEEPTDEWNTHIDAGIKIIAPAFLILILGGSWLLYRSNPNRSAKPRS